MTSSYPDCQIESWVKWDVVAKVTCMFFSNENTYTVNTKRKAGDMPLRSTPQVATKSHSNKGIISTQTIPLPTHTDRSFGDADQSWRINCMTGSGLHTNTPHAFIIDIRVYGDEGVSQSGSWQVRSRISVRQSERDRVSASRVNTRGRVSVCEGECEGLAWATVLTILLRQFSSCSGACSDTRRQ